MKDKYRLIRNRCRDPGKIEIGTHCMLCCRIFQLSATSTAQLGALKLTAVSTRLHANSHSWQEKCVYMFTAFLTMCLQYHCPTADALLAFRTTAFASVRTTEVLPHPYSTVRHAGIRPAEPTVWSVFASAVAADAWLPFD